MLIRYFVLFILAIVVFGYVTGCSVGVNPVPSVRYYERPGITVRPVFFPVVRPYRHHFRHYRFHHRPMRRHIRHHRRGELSTPKDYETIAFDSTFLAGHPKHRRHDKGFFQPVYAPPVRQDNPFAQPAEQGPPGIVECVFNNTSNRDAKVTVKVTYFASRGAYTPIRRVKWNYLTITAHSSRLVSFTMFPSTQYASHEVIVDRGEVNYQCRFGRR